MRTDPPPEDGDAARTALSRRGFVAAGGAAAGTVLGSGLAAAADGDGGRVVEATAPYLAAVRGAAASVSGVDVGRPRERGDPPELLVSGRPESNPETHGLADVLVDGRATLSNPDGTWRDALRPSTVGERWAADAPVEAWSEVAGDGPAAVGSVERPHAVDEITTLVRGTRDYQYARGHGGVGYYDVDGSAIAAPGQGDDSGSVDAVPIVRLAYVHARGDTESDDRLAAFLEEYGASAVATGDDGEPFVDPAVEG